jgi:hypothetical protein
MRYPEVLGTTQSTTVALITLPYFCDKAEPQSGEIILRLTNDLPKGQNYLIGCLDLSRMKIIKVDDEELRNMQLRAFVLSAFIRNAKASERARQLEREAEWALQTQLQEERRLQDDAARETASFRLFFSLPPQSWFTVPNSSLRYFDVYQIGAGTSESVFRLFDDKTILWPGEQLAVAGLGRCCSQYLPSGRMSSYFEVFSPTGEFVYILRDDGYVEAGC